MPPASGATATPRPRLQRIAIMAPIDPMSPETATGRAKALHSAVKDKLGFIPNRHRAIANAPAVTDGYLNLSGSLAKGTLSAKAGRIDFLGHSRCIGWPGPTSRGSGGENSTRDELAALDADVDRFEVSFRPAGTTRQAS